MKAALIAIAALLVDAGDRGSQQIRQRPQRPGDPARGRQRAVVGVDVVLQRRADLIPNLVETVKGFAAHETEVYQDHRRRARGPDRRRRHPQEKIAGQRSALRRAFPPAGDRGELSAAQEPTKTSCDCRMNSPAPKTASPWSAANTTRRWSTTTPRFRCSPTISWPRISGFTRNDAYFKTEPGAREAPKVQF